MECQHAPGQDQVASKLCGAEGHHSCSSGPFVVVSGGRFVWCCEVGRHDTMVGDHRNRRCGALRITVATEQKRSATLLPFLRHQIMKESSPQMAAMAAPFQWSLAALETLMAEDQMDQHCLLYTSPSPRD